MGHKDDLATSLLPFWSEFAGLLKFLHSFSAWSPWLRRGHCSRRRGAQRSNSAAQQQGSSSAAQQQRRSNQAGCASSPGCGPRLELVCQALLARRCQDSGPDGSRVHRDSDLQGICRSSGGKSMRACIGPRRRPAPFTEVENSV